MITASFLWYVTSIKTGRRLMVGNFGCIMQMGYKRYHPNSSVRFFSKAMNWNMKCDRLAEIG
jgi:hypothetical protein